MRQFLIKLCISLTAMHKELYCSVAVATLTLTVLTCD